VWGGEGLGRGRGGGSKTINSEGWGKGYVLTYTLHGSDRRTSTGFIVSALYAIQGLSSLTNDPRGSHTSATFNGTDCSSLVSQE
jgi:hypothetical protein